MTMPFNIVEEIQPDDADCAFDQPCGFGHRVEGHAVYCHNAGWADSPRKCRRTWATDGEIKDEDCPGFQPNEAFVGVFAPSPTPATPCSRCKGAKLIKPEQGRETVETCGHCMGDGAEPSAIPLSEYEQETLELGCGHSGMHSGRGRSYVQIAENNDEMEDVMRLVELDLILLRSVSFAGTARAVLINLTPKGDAVMRANWAQQ
jgi:hypothetical protein